MRYLAWLWVLLLLGLLSTSEERCSVKLTEPDTHWRLDGTPPSCSAALHASRKMGKNTRYTLVGERAYWMKDDSIRNGLNCLLGYSCLLSLGQAREVRTIELIPLEGAVQVDKLHPYLDGVYASDGTTLLYGWRRVPLKPPFNPERMRRIRGQDGSEIGYVTDGISVLYEDRLVDGADISSFVALPFAASKDARPTTFARDRHSVYYRGYRLVDADPATFELVDLAEDTVEFSGSYAVDHLNLWNLHGEPMRVVSDVADRIRLILVTRQGRTTRPQAPHTYPGK